MEIEQELVKAIKAHCDACPHRDLSDVLHACKNHCAEINEVLSNVMLLMRQDQFKAKQEDKRRAKYYTDLNSQHNFPAI